MSRGLNKIQIIGRLGRDPEMRVTSEGKNVTSFSVATGGTWTDSNGNERDDTEWFRVVAWERLAETCNNYLHKGDQVYIEGRLKTRKYEDENGVERTSVEVVASQVLILNSKNADSVAPAPRSEAPARQAPQHPAARQNGAQRPTQPARAARNVPQPIEDDDIPF